MGLLSREPHYGQSALPMRHLVYALPPRRPLGMNLSACFSYTWFAKLWQRTTISKNEDKYRMKAMACTEYEWTHKK